MDYKSLYTIVVTAILLINADSRAATHYVDLNSTNPTAPYTSWATAATGIQDAVDTAVDGDTVLVSNGTYAVTSEITVTNGILIESMSGPDMTIVDGGGSNRCFNLGTSSCTLAGFTIQNGHANKKNESTWIAQDGGGIYCENEVPVITNCTLSGNYAKVNGGGLYWGTADDCLFIGNTSLYGAGKAEGIANHCTFKKNVAIWDGGGLAYGAASYSTFEENVATFSGGGMAWGSASYCVFKNNLTDDSLSPGSHTLEGGGGVIGSTATNCYFIGNSTTDHGGGAFGSIVVNCFFAENKGALGGGMASLPSVDPEFPTRAINCTFTRNTAAIGGGLYRTAATNCIVWYNTASSMDNIRHPTSDNPAYEYLSRIYAVAHTCSPDVMHGVDGNITNAPMLASLSHIALTSPCIGAGTNLASGCDLDGEAWSNPPSMGCDQPFENVIGLIDLRIDNLPSKMIIGYEVDIEFVVHGPSSGFSVDFGDGQVTTNILNTSKRWNAPDLYDIVLTAHNSDYPTGISITQCVEVVTHEDAATYVAPDGNNTNSGTDWAAAKGTIQAGIDAQLAVGGTVWVTNGTYSLDSELIISNNIIIESVHGMETTIVDGGGSNRCFNLGDSRSTIRGLTIRNGYTEDSGGGVYCTNYSEAVIENCLITNNIATTGGGVYSGTAIDTIISGNIANYGGGKAYGLAHNCIVSNNLAGSGGGLYYGSAYHSIITDNRAEKADIWPKQGGGMYRGHTYNCILSRNFGYEGGGMYEGTAFNCTISSNSAFQGNGMKSGEAYNSIIWYNENYDLSGTQIYHCSTPDTRHGRDGNITNTPYFMDIATGDYRLQPNSPCINWGSSEYVTGTTDLDGNPRIVGTHVDMGAYEFQTDLGDDADGNGLSDEWERTYFGYRVLPTENPDGDAANNGDEFIAGTDPTDATSLFAVTNAAHTAEGFVVQWESQVGRSYSVWWSDALTNAFQVLATDLPYPVNSYTDTVHTVEGASFYQLEVEREN